ncbi:MAG: flagellar basal body rod protein FlgB [Candidatus Zixiibacteriota bacterium]
MPNPIQTALFDQIGIPRLERALDLTAARQRLLTENVANAETPGYRRKDINFAAELKAAQQNQSPVGMRMTRPGHITSHAATRTYKVVTDAPAPGDNYALSLDQEMAKVAENQLEYSIATRLVSRKFDGIQLAIRGRR